MIVATAGHVDHGKSTLVRLLTGTDPDRWVEEKRRGLTIDLGFARLDRDGIDIDVIDVPGHQRFLANMLAGCGSVDVALLVVSAREGWMAQTEEHLQILHLLGVRRGVVALTHADLVDSTTVEARTGEIAARLRGTGLEASQIVPTSPNDQRAVRTIADALFSQVRTPTTGPGNEADRPRLWIDRSFTVAGAGRVVTGTLDRGVLSVGDDVHLFDRDQVMPVRVRTLHAFNRSVSVAVPGARVGVGLAGTKMVPHRGWALARTDQWAWGRRLHVVVTPSRSANRQIPARGGYHVFIGTNRTPAQLRYGESSEPVDGDGVPPGTFLARLHLAEPVAPIGIGDRFILRDEGADLTLGGGTILAVDTQPTRYRAQELMERHRVVEQARRTGGLAASLADVLVAGGDGVVPVAELQRQAGSCPIETYDPNGSGSVCVIDDRIVGRRALERRRGELAESLTHGPVEVPTDAVGLVAMTLLIRSGGAEVRASVLTLPGSRSHQKDVERALATIEGALEGSGHPLITPAQLVGTVGVGTRVQKDLVRQGQLVSVGPFLTTKQHFDVLAQGVSVALADGPRPVSTIRTALDLPRRLVVPLLETLDSMGMTERVGDLRRWNDRSM